ncbi:MAG: nucleotide sugar dehydrogenase [Nitrospinales bacterium]
MNISIFGLGYVGCVSLGCLAKNGHLVIGVDLNSTKVDFINQGKASIVESEIDRIISRQHKSGNISATTNSLNAVMESSISIICVGTPSTDNGHLELGAIFNVAKEIGTALKSKDSFHVIVIRSTVLPGTNEKVVQIIENASGKKHDTSFAVVSNPEFLREGTAVNDYYNPAYTIVGSDNDKAINSVKEMYKGIKAPFIVTDIKIAELIKYVNNAFHANKIVFANEIGNICKKLNIDSHELMNIFCQDTKLNISPNYLKPGFCYGGSCLPKDLKGLKTIAHDHYLECPNLESIDKSNDLHKKIVLDQIIQFDKRKIGFLGLSFKGGTDDLRNSPVVDILEILLGKGFDIRIFDKNVHIAKLVGANRDYILKKIPYISKFIVSDESEIIKHSDVFIVVNEEDEYRQLLNQVPTDKIIYDLVNIDFDKKNALQNYTGISW